MDLIRSFTKYLPCKLRRRVRKNVARRRIHGEMMKSLYSQRDLADGEVERLEGEKRTIIKRTFGGLRDARDDRVAAILCGGIPYLSSEELDAVGINGGLVRVASDLRKRNDELTQALAESDSKYFAGVVEAVCRDKKIVRVPLVVYSGGEIIYHTPAFERMVGSEYSLENALRENVEFNDELGHKKKVGVEYNSGMLSFTPKKLNSGSVIGIACYIPNGDRKRAKAFGRFGEKAVGEIYKTLKSLDKLGIHFTDGE